MIEALVQDINKLEKLINLGYENSKKSLSSIVGEVAQIEMAPLEAWNVQDERIFQKSSAEQVAILTTDIIGDMKGKSYLLLGDEEVQTLSTHCKVPENMTDAFLLEIDNMLAAAVITVFSNYCDAKMYGGVPAISRVDGKELSSFISKDLHTIESFEGVCLVAETSFVFEGNLKITPQFLWFLPKDFVELAQKKVDLDKLS